jgi:hypothetical protein
LGRGSGRRRGGGLGLAHAASEEGRTPSIRGVNERRERSDVWSLTIKAESAGGRCAVDAELLAEVLRRLGGADTTIAAGGDKEKFLLDDGSGFTMRFWAEADSVDLALEQGRTRVDAVLEGLAPGDWIVVRAHATTPAERADDTFPGVQP